MALPSGFRERLEQMEQTRNQRLSLLQAEKELQIIKSQVLTARLSNIRSLERRCLNLDLKISSQYLIISSLKSEIDRLDSDYLSTLQKVRYLKNEVGELEELEKEKQKYYASENKEMDEFMEQVGNFVVECQVQIEELRSHANELPALIGQSKCHKGSKFPSSHTMNHLVAVDFQVSIFFYHATGNYSLGGKSGIVIPSSASHK